jgi:hypothetical protein
MTSHKHQGIRSELKRGHPRLRATGSRMLPSVWRRIVCIVTSLTLSAFALGYVVDIRCSGQLGTGALTFPSLPVRMSGLGDVLWRNA